MSLAPRPGIGDRLAAEQAVITIKVDGVPYTLRPSEMTARMSSQLRAQSGMSARAVMEAASEDPDLDVVAALVFLARRQAGEEVTWTEVADSISYGSEITNGEPEDEDPDLPEA